MTCCWTENAGKADRFRRSTMGFLAAAAAVITGLLPAAHAGTVIVVPPAAPPEALAVDQVRSIHPGTPVWVWDGGCAPARVLAPLPTPLPCAGGREVTVRLLSAERRPLAGVPILFAVEGMRGELPDVLLPSVPTDRDGRARLLVPDGVRAWVRAAGEDAATGWRELIPGLTLIGHPGRSLSLSVAGAGGPGEVVHLQLFARSLAGKEELLTSARFRGELRIPPYPRGIPVHLLVWGDDSAPRSLETSFAELPARLQLPAGGVVAGRVEDEKGKPVPGAMVTALFRLPSSNQAVQRAATVGPDGSFRLGGLPLGRVMLTVGSPGCLPQRREVELAKGPRADLALVLHRGRPVTLKVLDPEGAPLAGTVAELLPGVEAATSAADGMLRLPAVPASQTTVVVRCEGYLPRRVAIPERLEGPLSVTLQPAAGLRARFVFADTGEPVEGGRVEWTREDGERASVEAQDLPMDGLLQVQDRQPGVWGLKVFPEGGSPINLPHLALAAGQTLDLGAIEVSRGLAIAGTVFDDLTGAPLEGAAVTVLLPSPQGPRFAALQQEWKRAVTDAEGRFLLAGLNPGRFPVLVEAADRAPRLMEGIELDGEEPENTLALDPIWLGPPHRLDVSCTPVPRCGDAAAVLLGSPANDWAKVAAPLQRGKASVFPLPAGELQLRLTERGAVVTRRSVTLAKNEETTSVEISLAGTRVTGTVVLGEEPAAGGTVSFAPGGGDGIPEVIVNTSFPGQSVPDQQVLTGRGRTLHARVDSSGTFELQDVPPGAYSVGYLGTGGWAAPERSVTVPEGDEFHLELRFRVTRLDGVAVTADGRPPHHAFAVIRDSSGASASVLVDPAGDFSMVGLAPGPAEVRVEAEEGEGSARVDLPPDDVASVKVWLERRRPKLEVIVLSPEGTPLAGASVVALTLTGLELEQTDADGVARFTLPAAREGGAQLVAAMPGLGWAFGASGPASGDKPASATLTLPAQRGTLAVVGGQAMEAVHVATPSGLALERVLPLLGIPPAASRSVPLVLSGLPGGEYRVSCGPSESRLVFVRAGETATADFSEE